MQKPDIGANQVCKIWSIVAGVIAIVMIVVMLPVAIMVGLYEKISGKGRV